MVLKVLTLSPETLKPETCKPITLETLNPFYPITLGTLNPATLRSVLCQDFPHRLSRGGLLLEPAAVSKAKRAPNDPKLHGSQHALRRRPLIEEGLELLHELCITRVTCRQVRAAYMVSATSTYLGPRSRSLLGNGGLMFFIVFRTYYRSLVFRVLAAGLGAFYWGIAFLWLLGLDLQGFQDMWGAQPCEVGRASSLLLPLHGSCYPGSS